MRQDYLRTHYDNTRFQSREERAQGPLFALKKYHNAVKRTLLQMYATRADSLLDLCCGRGGDIQKWNACKIKRVVGLDISHKEILEARSRYETLYKPYTKCTFMEMDASVYFPTQTYDVVSCMFCLHYFFASEESLHTLLRVVSASLTPGGTFIGITPRDTRVLEFIKSGSSEYLDIRPLNIAPEVFGREYVFSLADTVTESVNSAGSVEYLVNFEVLTDMAAAHGLTLVSTAPVVPPDQYPGYEASLLFETFAFMKSF